MDFGHIRQRRFIVIVFIAGVTSISVAKSPEIERTFPVSRQLFQHCHINDEITAQSTRKLLCNCSETALNLL